ncbi:MULTISPECIES: nitroreductase family protein [unclassified Lentimonas]|uniref:nitroreductase family protein n=1 Tax=unclassified Lentimonas TaxID=2630993 RepID=UPI00138A2E51|nr:MULTISPECIES: nitroreductase family protein [unclassified Lentimonas]
MKKRASVAFNAPIAIEHIALRALDVGLGTCWMRLFNDQAVRELFNWEPHIYPVALIPVGTADETPAARKRRPLDEWILD